MGHVGDGRTVDFVTLGSHAASLNITFLFWTKKGRLFTNQGTSGILHRPVLG